MILNTDNTATGEYQMLPIYWHYLSPLPAIQTKERMLVVPGSQGTRTIRNLSSYWTFSLLSSRNCGLTQSSVTGVNQTGAHVL